MKKLDKNILSKSITLSRDELYFLLSHAVISVAKSSEGDKQRFKKIRDKVPKKNKD